MGAAEKLETNLNLGSIEHLADVLNQQIEKISAIRFEQYTSIPCGTEKFNKRDEVLQYDHWICHIIVGMQGINIAFRVHFLSKTARELASGILGAKSPLDPETCHSFMSEFSNLVAGEIKNSIFEILAQHLKVTRQTSFSVPQKSPSYDQGISERQADNFFACWELKWPGGTFLCTSTLKLDEHIIKEAYNVPIESLVNSVASVQVNEQGAVFYF